MDTQLASLPVFVVWDTWRIPDPRDPRGSPGRTLGQAAGAAAGIHHMTRGQAAMGVLMEPISGGSGSSFGGYRWRRSARGDGPAASRQGPHI